MSVESLRFSNAKSIVVSHGSSVARLNGDSLLLADGPAGVIAHGTPEQGHVSIVRFREAKATADIAIQIEVIDPLAPVTLLPAAATPLASSQTPDQPAS